ncbi:MAG: tetratricopeptide repeat protein, partial [Microcystis panniformis]
NIVNALGNLAIAYKDTKNYEQAKQTYLKVIELTQNLQGVDEQQKASILGNTYHNLGIVAEELREWEQARSYYQQALEIKIEYGAAGGTQSARFSQASTLHQLGSVAEELREWEQARSYYQQAIEIFIEYGERFSQAGTLHQLGRVAEEVGELSQAKSYYLQALQIWAEFNDGYWIPTLSLPRLVALYQQTQDEEIFVAAADILGIGVEEVRGLLEG